MSVEERAKNIPQNLEGTAQETQGTTTRDPRGNLGGEDQQLDEQTHQAAEDLKEEVKHKLDD